MNLTTEALYFTNTFLEVGLFKRAVFSSVHGIFFTRELSLLCFNSTLSLRPVDCKKLVCRSYFCSPNDFGSRGQKLEVKFNCSFLIASYCYLYHQFDDFNCHELESIG